MDEWGMERGKLYKMSDSVENSALVKALFIPTESIWLWGISYHFYKHLLWHSACKVKKGENCLQNKIRRNNFDLQTKEKGKGGGVGGVMDNWEEKVIYILAGVGFWQNVLHKFLYRFFCYHFMECMLVLKHGYTHGYTHTYMIVIGQDQ